MLAAIQIASLLGLALTGAGVVLTRDPLEQTVAMSFFGLVLALVFFLFQSPDVALSQIAIGAVALPLIVLLALAKIRRDDLRRNR